MYRINTIVVEQCARVLCFRPPPGQVVSLSVGSFLFCLVVCNVSVLPRGAEEDGVCIFFLSIVKLTLLRSSYNQCHAITEQMVCLVIKLFRPIPSNPVLVAST